MRIIAGELGGRLFSSPSGHATHPMSDRVRGGLFNILGDITGLTVLDAFAGSGALSFEAISRGAKSAIALESDRQAQSVLAENVVSLGLDGATHVINASANAWLGTNPDATFDIVLCDPPFDRPQHNLLQKLAERVNDHGLLVLCWPGKQAAPTLESLQLHSTHGYGDAQLLFFTR